MTIGSTTSLTDSTTAAASSTSLNALGSISSNYNQFLKLLTTQLQNQDPSSPTDTSQFTSELAQFAGVEQQVSTNTNLTSLIQLTQSQQVLQGSALLGKQVDMSSTTLPLQSGAAHLDYTATNTDPVTIVIRDGAGNLVARQVVTPAAAGSNGWDWNGTNTSGVQQADGPYTVKVTTTDAAGNATPLTFTTRGTVSGISRDGSSIDLALGTASVDMSKVVKVE